MMEYSLLIVIALTLAFALAGLPWWAILLPFAIWATIVVSLTLLFLRIWGKFR